MCKLKLLYAEDNETDLSSFRESISVYKDKKKRELDVIEFKSAEEAIKKLDNSFDGALIDLKLGAKGDEGNKVIEIINTSCFRIPIAILTGTPDNVEDTFKYIQVFKKGEAKDEDILDLFFGIYDTGLTRIMGGRGIIDSSLYKVFLNNIIDRKDIWIQYGKDNPKYVERTLLRFTLNHLMQLLDNEEDLCFPEEFYIHPTFSNEIRTGCIVKKKETDLRFVVLNPACDLVVRKKEGRKTDRILIVEIEPMSTSEGFLKNKTNAKTLANALKNNCNEHYHWLPETSFFGGGFINFRKMSSLKLDDFKAAYHDPDIQISQFFIKDIIARFSSYYARQGQPDFDFEKISEGIIKSNIKAK